MAKRHRKWFSFRKLRAFDAPIFMHWSLPAAVAVIALVALGSPVYGVLFVASYLAVILVHELGHAFVARRLGYQVNAIGLTMLHGWCRCDAPDDEWHAIIIAWGGVVAQVAIAVPVLLIAVALGERDWGYFTPVIVFLGYLNLVVAIINLLPDNDLDGKVAWRVVPLLMEKQSDKRALAGTLRSLTKRK